MTDNLKASLAHWPELSQSVFVPHTNWNTGALLPRSINSWMKSATTNPIRGHRIFDLSEDSRQNPNRRINRR